MPGKKKRENPAGCALLRGVQGFLGCNLISNITKVNIFFSLTALSYFSFQTTKKLFSKYRTMIKIKNQVLF